MLAAWCCPAPGRRGDCCVFNTLRLICVSPPSRRWFGGGVAGGGFVASVSVVAMLIGGACTSARKSDHLVVAVLGSTTCPLVSWPRNLINAAVPNALANASSGIVGVMANGCGLGYVVAAAFNHVRARLPSSDAFHVTSFATCYTTCEGLLAYGAASDHPNMTTPARSWELSRICSQGIWLLFPENVKWL